MSVKTRPCEICGAMLDPERAEFQPESRLCKTHSDEMEAKYGGEFLRTAMESSAQKSGSLKKAYGDVVVSSKTRNVAGLQKLQDEYERRGE